MDVSFPFVLGKNFDLTALFVVFPDYLDAFGIFMQQFTHISMPSRIAKG